MARAVASRVGRLITPEASSSACPESSCARVLRVTMRMAMIPAKKAPSMPARHALKPSAVMRSRAGPKMRLRAGLAPTVIASSARSACSGKTQL